MDEFGMMGTGKEEDVEEPAPAPSPKKKKKKKPADYGGSEFGMMGGDDDDDNGVEGLPPQASADAASSSVRKKKKKPTDYGGSEFGMMGGDDDDDNGVEGLPPQAASSSSPSSVRKKKKKQPNLADQSSEFGGMFGGDDDGDGGDDGGIENLPEYVEKKRRKRRDYIEKQDMDNPLFPMEGEGPVDGPVTGLDPSQAPDRSALARDQYISTKKKTDQLSADDQVKRYKKKQMGAYVFMGLQVFFIAVGVMDILIANSVAHSAEYGYDHSMYLFFLSGFCMIVLALFGIAGAMKKKSILPFHLYATVILFILTFFGCIFTLMREEAVDDFIDENFEELILLKDDPTMTRQDMKDGIDILMSLVSIVGFVTCSCYIVSGGMILWLVGTTRTVSTILVTVDGTLICGGIIVMYSGVDAGGETHAFSDLLAFSVYCAYALGVVMIIMGILFMFIKQRAMADGEAFFDEHPQKSFVFAILLGSTTFSLFLLAVMATTQYTAVNDNVNKGWDTQEFLHIRRAYLSHRDASDALRGKVLALILGYLGLLIYMLFLGAAFWYIFGKARFEKMQQYKQERNKKRAIGRDRLKKRKTGTKHAILVCMAVFLTLLFLMIWISASSEFGCKGEKALEGMKTELLDGLTNNSIYTLETDLEDKLTDSSDKVPYVFNSSIGLHTKCKMGSSTREEVKLYYRIFSKEAGDAGGTTEHLLYKSKSHLSHKDRPPFEDYHLLTNKKIRGYQGAATLKVQAEDCRHKFEAAFDILISH